MQRKKTQQQEVDEEVNRLQKLNPQANLKDLQELAQIVYGEFSSKTILERTKQLAGKRKDFKFDATFLSILSEYNFGVLHDTHLAFTLWEEAFVTYKEKKDLYDKYFEARLHLKKARFYIGLHNIELSIGSLLRSLQDPQSLQFETQDKNDVIDLFYQIHEITMGRLENPKGVIEIQLIKYILQNPKNIKHYYDYAKFLLCISSTVNVTQQFSNITLALEAGRWLAAVGLGTDYDDNMLVELHKLYDEAKIKYNRALNIENKSYKEVIVEQFKKAKALFKSGKTIEARAAFVQAIRMDTQGDALSQTQLKSAAKIFQKIEHHDLTVSIYNELGYKALNNIQQCSKDTLAIIDENTQIASWLCNTGLDPQGPTAKNVITTLKDCMTVLNSKDHDTAAENNELLKIVAKGAFPPPFAESILEKDKFKDYYLTNENIFKDFLSLLNEAKILSINNEKLRTQIQAYRATLEAILTLNENKYELAIQKLTAIPATYLDPETLKLLADLYIKTNNPSSALAYYVQALKGYDRFQNHVAKSHYATCGYQIAFIYLHQNNQEKAYTFLLRAMYLDEKQNILNQTDKEFVLHILRTCFADGLEHQQAMQITLIPDFDITLPKVLVHLAKQISHNYQSSDSRLACVYIYIIADWLIKNKMYSGKIDTDLPATIHYSLTLLVESLKRNANTDDVNVEFLSIGATNAEFKPYKLFKTLMEITDAHLERIDALTKEIESEDFLFPLEPEEKSLADLHYQRGHEYASEKKFNKAIEDFRRSIKYDPEQIKVLEELIELEKLVNDAPALEAHTQQLAQLKKQKELVDIENKFAESNKDLSEEQRHRAAHLTLDVTTAFKGKDYSLASQKLQELESFCPLDLPGHFQKGRIFLLNKEYEKAVASLEKCLSLPPHSEYFLDAHFYLCTSYFQLYVESNYSLSNIPPIYNELKIILEFDAAYNKLSSEQSDCLKKVFMNIQRRTHDITKRNALGMMAELEIAEKAAKKNNYNLALKHINKAIADQPHNPYLYGLRGNYMQHLDNSQEYLKLAYLDYCYAIWLSTVEHVEEDKTLFPIYLIYESRRKLCIAMGEYDVAYGDTKHFMHHKFKNYNLQFSKEKHVDFLLEVSAKLSLESQLKVFRHALTIIKGEQRITDKLNQILLKMGEPDPKVKAAQLVKEEKERKLKRKEEQQKKHEEELKKAQEEEKNKLKELDDQKDAEQKELQARADRKRTAKEEKEKARKEEKKRKQEMRNSQPAAEPPVELGIKEAPIAVVIPDDKPVLSKREKRAAKKLLAQEQASLNKVSSTEPEVEVKSEIDKPTCQLPLAAVKVFAALEEAKSKHNYIVGGYVRDTVHNQQQKNGDTTNLRDTSQSDLDFVTELNSKKIRIIFESYEMKTWTDTHITIFIEGRSVDIYPSKHLANKESANPVLDDANARDFSMNALYLDKDGNIHDPTGKAFAAIEEGFITTINENAVASLTEDPLRILRAIKFKHKLALPLDNKLAAAIGTCKHLLSSWNELKICTDLNGILTSDYRLGVFSELVEQDIFATLYPELTNKISTTDLLQLFADSNKDLTNFFTKLILTTFIDANKTNQIMQMNESPEKLKAIQDYILQLKIDIIDIVNKNKFLNFSFSKLNLNKHFSDAMQNELFLMPLYAQQTSLEKIYPKKSSSTADINKRLLEENELLKAQLAELKKQANPVSNITPTSHIANTKPQQPESVSHTITQSPLIFTNNLNIRPTKPPIKSFRPESFQTNRRKL